LFFAKCLTAALALWLLFQTIGATQMAASMIKVDYAKLSVALVLLVPNLAVQILKWRFMLEWTGTSISFAMASRSILAGYPLGFVTPGRLGEIGRAFWITGIPRRQTLKLALMDKLSNMGITLLAGALSSLWFVSGNLTGQVALSGASALLALLVITGAVYNRVRQKVETLSGASSLRRSQIAVVYLFSFFFYVVFTLQFVLLVHAFESGLYVPSACAAGAVFFTKTLLPVSLSDLGIREGAAVFFFGRIGISPGASINAAFCLFLINVCLPTLAGIVILIKSGIHAEPSHSIPQPG
jgi:uncharacterized membrane protein YbhN (UPF0104 family)